MDIANSNENRVAIFAISTGGTGVGRRLKIMLPGSHLYRPEKYAVAAADEYPIPGALKDAVAKAFGEYRFLVLILATGIAVRLLAPLVEDKHRDTGVVVVDDAGTFAISLLSGHVGGANKFTRQVASCLGATPVITTASEIAGTIPVDILGREYGWEIEDSQNITRVSMALVNGEPVGFYQDTGERNWWPNMKSWPDNIQVFPTIESLFSSNLEAALVITDRIWDIDKATILPELTVIYRPKSLVVGIGCNRGTSGVEIEAAIHQVFSQNNLSIKSVKNLATIDLKKDEAGLQELASKYNWPLDYFDNEALSRTDFPSPASETVMEQVGTPAVCEAAAILSSKGPIVVPKESYHRAVTIAIARLPFEDRTESRRGKLFIVGTGPGHLSQMTLRAREAIDQSEVVVGYKTYVRLIEPLLGRKEVISTGMGAEVERVKIALAMAKKGRTVSVISSGDAGVYGMAGLVGEILSQNEADDVEIEVVPGVTALASSAALLGSPLTNDFACISLSDHLVSWEELRERLKHAAQGNFVIVLYNPKSTQRPNNLEEAREIILRYRPGTTPVGIVTSAYRPEQQVVITDLEHLPEQEVNMNSTVIIGNSLTTKVKDWMVTPRGYQNKYDLKGEY